MEEGSLGVPAQTAALTTQPRIMRKKMDGWMLIDRRSVREVQGIVGMVSEAEGAFR